MFKRLFRIQTLLFLVAIIILVLLFRYYNQNDLPGDIVSGNGRIEATDIIIASRLPGRVKHVFVKEGELVKKGQQVAAVDTTPLQAVLREATARLKQAKEHKNYADAMLKVRQSELILADKQYERLQTLAKSGNASTEQLDQSVTQQTRAAAGLQAARIQIIEAAAAIEAMEANVARVQTNIDDSVLLSTINGRVLYRLAEPGEVIGAGGRVLVLVDLTDIHMSIFLPTSQASLLSIGDEARLVLDAIPDNPLPAKISFVSPIAQFTPKAVETRVEREKLMFRVKLKIEPKLLARHIDKIKTGVPGEGYVRLDKQSPWPENLKVNLPAE